MCPVWIKKHRIGLLAVGIVSLAIIGTGVWVSLKPKTQPVEPSVASTVVPIRDEGKLVSRDEIWQSISAQIERAGQKGKDDLPERVENALRKFDTFLELKRDGIRTFAASVVSWRDIWALAKAQVSNAARDEHHQTIRNRFEECVFPGSELERLAVEIVESFVKQCDADDAPLLESCRTALLTSDGPSPDTVSPDSFRSAYRAAVPAAVARMNAGVRDSVDQVLVEVVARTVANHVAAKLARVIAIRAGVVAAASIPFGVGIVAHLILTIALDAVLPNSSDPVSAVSEKIEETLIAVIQELKEGSDEYLQYHSALSISRERDPSPELRARANHLVAKLESSGRLGLRRELFQIAKQRAAVRDSAMKTLVLGESAK